MKVDLESQVIWFLLDDPAWSDDQIEPWLSDSDRQRCARLIFPHHRQRQRVSCAVLRRLLSHLLQRPPHQLVWERADHGKPYLPQAGCFFNLSHSENIAGLAVSPWGEIGLDVEDRRRRVEYLSLGRRFFAPAEADALQHAADPRDFFFQVWTAKEAYIKALGDGLSHPLDQFLTYHQERWGLFDLQGQTLDWKLQRPSCPFAEASAALVCRESTPLKAYLYGPEGHWQACP